VVRFACSISKVGLDVGSHARTRCRQRGVKLEVIEFILDHYDGGCFVGDGRVSAFVTKRKLERLRQDGFPAALVERARGVILVLGDAPGGLVTVMHWRASTGARYTRQFAKWNSRRFAA
jgi:hypothetical protein